mmetsp:Transcript_13667/g.59632  ORF Transcript_13667/g.59632 Transcript_13667/m.59632 type:complete len:112 (-) Transcript_13667:384-719(-)
MLVFAKREVGRPVSVQRIVNALASGTPVLIESEHPEFRDFVANFNYTCDFDSKNALQKLLQKSKQRSLRQGCVSQAVLIVQEYSPLNIVMKYVAMFDQVGNATSNNSSDFN